MTKQSHPQSEQIWLLKYYILLYTTRSNGPLIVLVTNLLFVVKDYVWSLIFNIYWIVPTNIIIHVLVTMNLLLFWGHHDRYRMVVGFTTTYAYQCQSPLTLWVRIPLRQGVLDTTLCDKFVSDLRQVSGFLLILRFPLQIKTDCHDITEILLKMALKTINLKTNHYSNTQ